MSDLLIQLHQKTETDREEFDASLQSEAIKRATQFIKGVRLYQQSPFSRYESDTIPVLWQDGTTCLRDYGEKNRDAPVLLVIPSLINRYDILDLEPDHSFLRACASAGYRPLVVDWGNPGPLESRFGISHYIYERLAPILAVASQLPGAKHAHQKVHVLGYCMGGLLALALTALHPNTVKSLSLFATPWDFHKPDASVGMSIGASQILLYDNLQRQGSMPVDLIQTLFAFIQPLQTTTKFANFATLNPTSDEARRFVLLEDWLNHGVPLTLPTAEECLKGWYGQNQPALKKWRVTNQIIDPQEIHQPSYVVVPTHDHIVPPESARPLAHLLPQATLHEPATGHIGMITSSRAPKLVWDPYFRWLSEHL